jgi:hypothetical protein
LEIIVLTIGRKLWLFIDALLPRRHKFAGVVCHDERQVFGASVAFVNSTLPGEDYHRVTVTFADHVGVIRSTIVPLRQVGQNRPDAREWCEWMPSGRRSQ